MKDGALLDRGVDKGGCSEEIEVCALGLRELVEDGALRDMEIMEGRARTWE